jgi:hypothetical protein
MHYAAINRRQKLKIPIRSDNHLLMSCTTLQYTNIKGISLKARHLCSILYSTYTIIHFDKFSKLLKLVILILN